MGHWVRKVTVTSNCNWSAFTIKGQQTQYGNAGSGNFFFFSLFLEYKQDLWASQSRRPCFTWLLNQSNEINTEVKKKRKEKEGLWLSCWEHNDLNTCMLPSISARGITHGSSLSESVWVLKCACLIPSNTSDILKSIIFSFHLHTRKTIETIIQLEDRVMFSVVMYYIDWPHEQTLWVGVVHVSVHL